MSIGVCIILHIQRSGGHVSEGRGTQDVPASRTYIRPGTGAGGQAGGRAGGQHGAGIDSLYRYGGRGRRHAPRERGGAAGSGRLAWRSRAHDRPGRTTTTKRGRWRRGEDGTVRPARRGDEGRQRDNRETWRQQGDNETTGRQRDKGRQLRVVQFRTEHEKPPSDATTAGQRAQLFSPFLPSLLLSLVPRSFFPSSACLFFFFFSPADSARTGVFPTRQKHGRWRGTAGHSLPSHCRPERRGGRVTHERVVAGRKTKAKRERKKALATIAEDAQVGGLGTLEIVGVSSWPELGGVEHTCM